MSVASQRLKNAKKALLALVITYVISVVILFIIILLFMWNGGDHPGCAINDSVAPCGYWNRVLYYSKFSLYLAYLIMPFVALAEIILLNYLKKRRISKSQLDS